MKNLEKLLQFLKQQFFQAWKVLLKEFFMEFCFTNLCIIAIFNQVLNLCAYSIVLLIPAAFEFIIREIPAKIYWI